MMASKAEYEGEGRSKMENAAPHDEDDWRLTDDAHTIEGSITQFFNEPPKTELEKNTPAPPQYDPDLICCFGGLDDGNGGDGGTNLCVDAFGRMTELPRPMGIGCVGSVYNKGEDVLWEDIEVPYVPRSLFPEEKELEEVNLESVKTVVAFKNRKRRRRLRLVWWLVAAIVVLSAGLTSVCAIFWIFGEDNNESKQSLAAETIDVDVSGWSPSPEILVGIPSEGSLTPTPSTSLKPVWEPQDDVVIEGQVFHDAVGNSVAMSADGNVVAVGGHRTVLLINSTESSNITEKELMEPYVPQGNAVVALSANGRRLVVADPVGRGSVWIIDISTKDSRYKTWVGADELDGLGRALALSADGCHLAVGTDVGRHWVADSKTESALHGYVSVYQCNDNNDDEDDWILRRTLTGEGPRFGGSLALAVLPVEETTVLAVGDIGADEYEGAVHIYLLVDNEEVDEDNLSSREILRPITYTDDENDEVDWFGHAVSLSTDASVLAVGAYMGGYVAPYSWVGGSYRSSPRLRPPVSHNGANGDLRFTGFGYAVAVSGDGDRLAVGAPFYRSEGIGAVLGYASDVVENNGDGDDNDNHWRAMGIISEGRTVALNHDGSVVAVGDPDYTDESDPIGLYRHGRVRLYHEQPSPTTDHTPHHTVRDNNKLR